MSIIVVRHGETALNAARVVQPADTPLNGRGVAQARLVARRLLGMGVDHILCSDLTRTRMTAKPLEALTGLSAELSPLLQERNFGAIRGRPYADVSPEIFADDYAPPGGETWEVFRARVARAFEAVVARRQTVAGNLVVITHGLVCKALSDRHIAHADGGGFIRWGNTSVTVLDPSPPHTASVLNCTRHLDAAAADDGDAPSGI